MWVSALVKTSFLTDHNLGIGLLVSTDHSRIGAVGKRKHVSSWTVKKSFRLNFIQPLQGNVSYIDNSALVLVVPSILDIDPKTSCRRYIGGSFHL